MALRPLGESGSRTHWAEPKRCRSLSMSDTGWDLLTRLAAVKGLSRSEAAERLIRKACEFNDVQIASADEPT